MKVFLRQDGSIRDDPGPYETITIRSSRCDADRADAVARTVCRARPLNGTEQPFLRFAVVPGLRRLLQRPHLDDAVRNSAGSS